MIDLPLFGARLARLLEHRDVPAAGLTEAAGVPITQVDAVLAGAEPDDEQLRAALHYRDGLQAAGGVPYMVGHWH
ncbi:hypothetical protein GCM10009827_087200 [Dactylosporangium maewongense]|uniref:Uncharacterized protein n=1 Tax=Dactylosporangium maewongense TaxID=634393 RepID=A0ABP4MZH3_9ACTN